MRDMSIASELFIIGFDGLSLSGKVHQFLLNHRLGGLILFKRNIASLKQVIALNASIINQSHHYVPLISVDQEGGRVARLRGLCTDIPPLAELTPVLIENPQLCYRLGAMMARELVALGFHLNFAPICDIAVDQKSDDIIGDRAFSHEAEQVASLVGPFINGMQSSGIAASAKHFPGHGATVVDSHFELPYVNTDKALLKNRELLPFQHAINNNVATIMTAHIIAKCLDADVPATMSKIIIEDLLRNEMNYQNVVISDDLDMKAVADNYSLKAIIEQSLMASVDMFIIGNNWDKSEEAIAITDQLIASNIHIKAKVMRALERVRALRARYIGAPLAPSMEYAQNFVRCAPHLAIIEACISRG